ncbi:MAG: sugar transferase [Planctomycetes bacterium]|nr:sugar transferase [Planctomycetota bacterium]
MSPNVRTDNPPLQSRNLTKNPSADLQSAPENSSPTSPAQTVAPRHQWYLPIKRGLDLLGAVVLLVFLAPFIALGALLVKLTSRGPAFYCQTRVGQGGVEFPLYKLRTMRQDAEKDSGPVWSAKNDTRVTPLGKLLRSSHIDEFPQLWNVIQGHMSLVGPRPERPEFVAKLEWEVPNYRERLNIHPGITGLAQLKLPPDVTIECVRRKVEHDIYYIRHVNPWLDAKLMVFTAWRLVGEILHFGWKSLILPSSDDIQQHTLQLRDERQAHESGLGRVRPAKPSQPMANDTVEMGGETLEADGIRDAVVSISIKRVAEAHGHSPNSVPSQDLDLAPTPEESSHRLQLMEKRESGEITDEELLELDALQKKATEHRQRVAPPAFAEEGLTTHELEKNTAGRTNGRHTHSNGAAPRVGTF